MNASWGNGRNAHLALFQTAVLCFVTACVSFALHPTPARADTAGAPRWLRSVPFAAWGVATNAFTHTTYLGSMDSATLGVLDDRTGSFAAKKNLTGCCGDAYELSVDPAHALYLNGGLEAGTYRIDERTFRATIVSANSIWDMAADQKTDTVFLSESDYPVIEVLAGGAGKRVGTLHTDGDPTFMGFNSATRKLYVETYRTNPDGSSTGHVEVIDTATRQPVGRLWNSFATGPMVVDQRHNLVYGVTENYGSGPAHGVAVIDGRTDTVRRWIPLPNQDSWYYGKFVLDQQNGTLYLLANESQCTYPDCNAYLVTVNIVTAYSSNPIRIGKIGNEISIDPGLRRLYVTNGKSVLVFAI